MLLLFIYICPQVRQCNNLLFVFYFVAEQEVDGPSFVQLTEESIRSNFPAVKFGQRKACCKIINSILASKDNFSFSELEVEDSNDKSELYDAAKVKVMNFEELSKFLQNRDLLPETVQLLLSMCNFHRGFVKLESKLLISYILQVKK